MHLNLVAPKTSSKRINDESPKEIKEEIAAWAGTSFRDPSFFSSLASIQQIYVLDAMCSSKNFTVDQRRAFLSCCLTFFNSVNSVSFVAAPSKVTRVVRSLAQNDFMITEMAATAYALGQCLERVLINRSAITALHATYLQLCVSLDLFDIALPLILTPTHDIDPVFLPTSLEYISFQYLSGLIFASFKQFDKALMSFDLVIGAVSVQISTVQIAAYKKRTLVDIILNGSDTTRLPKLVCPVVAKNIEALSSPYQQFETGAAAGYQNLAALFQEYQSQLQQDGNVGLAKQALVALQKTQIAKLAGSYVTLPLMDIARMVGIEDLPSVEAVVLSMIDEGSIDAIIDQSRQMLTFKHDSESFTDPGSLSKLYEQLLEINAARDRILDKNISLSTDTLYVKKSVEGNAKSESSNSELHFNEVQQQLFG